MITADELVKQATRLGYDKCGIIPLDSFDGYKDKLASWVITQI